jgi:hypothetical protein
MTTAITLPSFLASEASTEGSSHFATRVTPDVSVPGVAVPGRWYWAQIVRSMPVFLWLPVRRGGWLPTVGVALGVCAVQAMIELTTKFAVVGLFPSDSRWPAILTLAVTLPSLALLSYMATRIRSGAATMLTVVVVFAVVVQLAVKDGFGMTMWSQLATLVVGPSMAFTGGVLSMKTRTGWASSTRPTARR